MIPYETQKILHLGDLGGIYLSPLLNGIGFIFSFLIVLKLAKQYKLNVKELITIYVIIGLFGIGFGTRVFYYFGPWGLDYTFIERLINLFNFQKPGMVYYGGYVFSILGIFLYCKYKNLKFKNYINPIAIGTFLGQFFGRIGCFFQGCCYGRETLALWGFESIKTGVVRFPTQTMLSINALVLFITLFALKKKYKNLLFPIGLILYSLTRFIIEFMRDYEWAFWGFSFSQWTSIIIFIWGIWIFNKWKND